MTGIPSSVALRWTLALTDTRSATATADFGVKCAQPAPSPQPFGVFATCASRHGSTYDAIFGYINENRHPLTIPIGARNSVGIVAKTIEVGTARDRAVIVAVPRSNVATAAVHVGPPSQPPSAGLG